LPENFFVQRAFFKLFSGGCKLFNEIGVIKVDKRKWRIPEIARKNKFVVRNSRHLIGKEVEEKEAFPSWL